MYSAAVNWTPYELPITIDCPVLIDKSSMAHFNFKSSKEDLKDHEN